MFGNDGSVGAKSPASATFGNDAESVGFIRVRKRKLKGGHPSTRVWRPADQLATASMTFDLMRAVRVSGIPRQQFVLGLGSQRNVERYGLCSFWKTAIYRMTKHGLSEHQRRRLMAAMVRKGARLPTLEACERSAANDRAITAQYGWRHSESAMDELARFIRASENSTTALRSP